MSITFEKYQSIEALNYSTLKLIDISPKYLKHVVDNRPPDKDSYRQGRATHCSILEPLRFQKEYIPIPNFGDMRTKAAKESKAEWLERVPYGVEVITEEEYALCIRQSKAVTNHTAAMELISGSKFEQVVTWDALGIKCKARVDIVAPGRIADLKTTRHLSVDDIWRDIMRYNYHAQLAWYHDACVNAGLVDGLEMPCIIAVHGSLKSEYCDVAVFDLSHQAIDIGRKKYMSWLQKYAGCVQSEWWPGMAEYPVTMQLPSYKIGEVDDEI